VTDHSTAIAPVTVTQRIAASPSTIFALLVDPTRHPDLDGTAMLQGALTTEKVSAVGDEFRMAMRNSDMGDYEMTSRVVAFEPDRRIHWAPRMTASARPEILAGSIREPGYVWGWDLRPVDEGVTEVTESFECSRAPAELREAIQGGEVWRAAMAASLRKMSGLCGS
jgi:uncharacterized protein YndB with AHSA1/START domain